MLSKSIDDKVKYTEGSVGVARFLKQRGYELANSNGYKQDEPSQDVVGILKPREPISHQFLGFKWDSEQSALYIGRLWLENLREGATLENKWVLEVYGRAHVLELSEVAKDLAKEYEIGLDIKLRRELPYVESKRDDDFSGDY